jgi:hypothetical protein
VHELQVVAAAVTRTGHGPRTLKSAPEVSGARGAYTSAGSA